MRIMGRFGKFGVELQICAKHRKVKKMKIDRSKIKARLVQDRRLHTANIPSMYFSTSLTLILTEVTGVFSVLVDGILTSRFLGADVYSGISLLRPFFSIVLMLAGFLSTGCMVLCSRLVGTGQKKEANQAFLLALFLALLVSAVLMLVGLLFPSLLLRVCGVSLRKYPELNTHLYAYLRSYVFGIPAIMLVQIIGPVVVMDSGKRLFSASSLLLCAAAVAGDVLNVFVFHGGAFGMGLTTSASYLLQLLLLLLHFTGRGRFFRISPGLLSFRQLREIFHGGSPALIRKAAVALRDVSINYLNLAVALSTAAVAAKGIQADLFEFLFCIPTGLGRALITMTGIYFGANDRRSLKRLYVSALQEGFLLTAAAGILAFAFARPITLLYSGSAEVVDLTVYSIRWMSFGLMFDTTFSLIQHFLQGTRNQKLSNALSISERLIVPVAAALVLGMLFGSKGILAATAIAKMILFLLVFVIAWARNRRVPRSAEDIMFLPDDFGGAEENNFYFELRSREDVVLVSREVGSFCRYRGASERAATLMELFTEEMALNIYNHAEKVHRKRVYADFHLYADARRLSFSLMDRSDSFDPTAFYELHRADGPEEHIGIRMVTEMATEVHYYRTYSSNNLIVQLEE